MTRPFRFKQFTIEQKKTPMKVGTDSVLLGAWCNGSQEGNIIDIGTGTGILTLMMAQRFPKSRITAIEAHTSAYEEALFNIESSLWANQIELLHKDLATYNPQEKFDLILANPPYFHEDLKSPEKGKAAARHADHFDVKGFAACTAWLKPDGRLAGIYPVDIYQRFEREMALLSFYPLRIMEVCATPVKPAHRILFEFSAYKTSKPTYDSIVIERNGRHVYSEEYKALTSEFYLNF